MNTSHPSPWRRPRVRSLFLSLGAFALAALGARAQVTSTIYTADFASGTAGWYSSAASDITWNAGGSLRYNTTPVPPATSAVNTHLLGYFDPVTLSLGSKLEITYSISFANVPAGNSRSFRIGLFDSGGAQISESGLGQSLSTFNDYDGYRTDHFLNLTTNSTSNPIRFTSRSGTGPSLIIDATAYGTTSSQPATFGGYYGIQSDVTYMTSYSLERTLDDQLILTYAFWNPAVEGSGHARAHTLSGTLHYTFDTLAFGVVNTIADSFTLDNVIVTHTAIPEPSTYALCGGIVALLAVGVLRRRRAVKR